MSKANQIAEAMAARLNALATLPDVTAVVWRQKDLQSELAKKTNQASGALIVILYAGFTNPDTAATVHLTLTRRYIVSVFSKPVIRHSRQTSADEIVEVVARSLHNWEPDEDTVGSAEIRVANCEVRPDAEYLIYDMDIECISRL